MPSLDENGYVAEPDAEWSAQQRAMLIVDCGLCDDDGRAGGFPCDHKDRTEIYKRGMDKVRAAMGWDA